MELSPPVAGLPAPTQRKREDWRVWRRIAALLQALRRVDAALVLHEPDAFSTEAPFLRDSWPHE